MIVMDRPGRDWEAPQRGGEVRSRGDMQEGSWRMGTEREGWYGREGRGAKSIRGNGKGIGREEGWVEGGEGWAGERDLESDKGRGNIFTEEVD